jgi:hypothetical protein
VLGGTPSTARGTRALPIFLAYLLTLVCLLNVSALERLEPSEGCYFGFTLNEKSTIEGLRSRLSFTPAVYSRFFAFPLSGPSREALEAFFTEVSTVQGIAMVTLETWAGLESVTAAHCNTLGEICATAEARGLSGIFIRFGHEMNGNWYRWGQKPILYKKVFKIVADAIHARTGRTAMIWAPNYGVGYPFGKPLPDRDTPDFIALDTNHDGQITDRDDPYAPYYPGDDVVDWVGMTIYHWGISYPWFENEMPLPDNFAGSLTGKYQGNVPNFYDEYCVRRGKPLAIPETAAFYNTEQPGPDPLLLKQAWWRQVFSATSRFPKLKCINWFDEFKREGVAQSNWIDWRVSADSRIRTAFLRDFFSISAKGRPFFLTAQDVHCLDAANCISAEWLPTILPTNGEIAVSIDVRAAANCDLVIDLLDSKFRWKGGTRVAISAPGQNVITSFRLVQPLTDQTGYRWSIFLTPSGADYLKATAWYNGPNPSEDPDGDGLTNEEEFIAGTNPRDPADVLSLSIDRSATGLLLSWDSRIGKSYQVLATFDLKSWVPVSGSIQGTGKTIHFTVNTPTGSKAANYRVRIVQ